MTALKDRLKAKRLSESQGQPEEQRRSHLVTTKDVDYRNKRAASPLANTSLKCSVCEMNHTTFKYFLTRKSWFPICGDCMFNSNMRKIKDMDVPTAIQCLKDSSH